MGSLEQLPPDLFYEITRFLPLVDYQDDFGDRDPHHHCSSDLIHRYALAVVSRRCHDLFEETANTCLRKLAPHIFWYHFRPPLPRNESASCLRQLYALNAAASKFRYECCRLHGVLLREKAEPEVLLEQARSLLAVEHIVVDWEEYMLLACLAACRRALNCGKVLEYIDLEQVMVDAIVSTAACPLLQQIISRYEARLQALLPDDEPHGWKDQLLVTLAVYYVALIQSEPPNEPAAVVCLQTALDMYDTREFVDEFDQKLRLSMYLELARLHVDAERFDEGFALLQRARDDTRRLDPLNVLLLAKLAHDFSHEFGLERSIAFCRESVNQLEETMPSELIRFEWVSIEQEEVYNHCIRKCRERLRDLERRRRQG